MFRLLLAIAVVASISCNGSEPEDSALGAGVAVEDTGATAPDVDATVDAKGVPDGSTPRADSSANRNGGSDAQATDTAGAENDVAERGSTDDADVAVDTGIDAKSSCTAPADGATAGYAVGETLADLTFQTCAGAPFSLNGLCGADVTWVFIAHSW